ncbi:MAG: recombinase family protein [Candidatus Pseudobacter hemicellulosilyticus]|uniref:Recombinase family protein n=1 Tax=Candidatus Pseudobacter hemicellulosilyticus TaxID=3121375 RepID=A0AAJ5WN13_9BACT|nr:MAG: recombinase family protein [Pseudobacter sp.]
MPIVKQQHTKPLLETNFVVTLSRVSTKKQVDGLSLENQNKYYDEHAERTGKEIVARFGKTHESASTDERKEFKWMLEFVKKNNRQNVAKKISEIWVYMTDRFSRTGVGGMGIAEELREKYGVALYSLAQPTNVKEESGVFSQNMQFLMSNYENKLRRKRMIDGMTAKFEKGEWVTKPPQGYSVIKNKKERKIVVNEEGKKIRQAFIWKAEGMKNDEIIKRLRAMGLKMYKQQLTKIFKKPFYCGLINHGLLDGRIVQGNHEPMISPELFLKVNEIYQNTTGYGVSHERENKYLPLKVYAKCKVCGQPFTGYARKKKTKKTILVNYYYKCRTTGCRCNKNADSLHLVFKDLLAKYKVKDNLIPVVYYKLANAYNEASKASVEQVPLLKAQLTEIEKKLENIEEKYYALGQMSRETFEKFQMKYQTERSEISKLLAESAASISTLNEQVHEAVQYCSKVFQIWDSSEIGVKDLLQKLIFPEGIEYNRENDTFRPLKTNFIFELISRQIRVSDENKKGINHTFDDLSPAAEREGFEPPDL